MADPLVVTCTLGPAALKARRENLLHVLLNERQCCRFLRFAVTVEPDHGPITVYLTGPAGTREFLAAMFDV
jgi:hypothetical protein